MKASPSSASPGLTVWIACILSSLVLAGGITLARRTERVAVPPPGNRMDDTFRLAIDHLTGMERQWEEALHRETEELQEGGRGPWSPRTVGTVRFAEVSALKAPPESETAGNVPVLEKYSKGVPGEWTLDPHLVYGEGFRESPGHPLIYGNGNGKKIIVLVLSREEAADLAINDLRQDAAYSFRDEPGRFEWKANAPRIEAAAGPQPDEILRHVSRFGNIELRRWYPVRVVTSYHVPTVAGASTLAALMMVAGVMGAASQRRALRVAEERVSFVNRVSHELRSPLTNLLLTADLALDELPPEEDGVRRRLGLIREETGRLSRIVENVLAFARLERSTEIPVAAPCRPADLISKARESFAPLFARKGIRADWRVRVDGAAAFDGDAFSQILSNLLSNVEKYAGSGAACVITAEAEDGGLALTVTDDGPGIAPAARKRIFRPFTRGGDSTSEGVSGTGLGLSISRELAARMGGRLVLLDTESGASFRLWIPLHGGKQS